MSSARNAAVGLALIGSITAGIPATSAHAADKVGEIRLLGTNKCLDLPNSSSANGTVVQKYDCNGTDAQRWTFTPTGNAYAIKAFGKCLDVAHSWTTENWVQLYDCNGTPAQQWEILVPPYENPTVQRYLRNKAAGGELTSYQNNFWARVRTAQNDPYLFFQLPA